MNERLSMQEQIKVEDYVKVGRNMIADLRAGAMGVLSNKPKSASVLELIVDRLAFLEREALKPRGGAITLERERSLLHITAGDDQWSPTDAELDAIVQKFKTAEFDSNGLAFVATRNSVNVTEITGSQLGTLPLVMDE